MVVTSVLYRDSSWLCIITTGYNYHTIDIVW